METLAEGLQRAFESMLQSWFEEHPIPAWLAAHPWVTVGLILLLILLLRGLLGAIARLVEQIWLAILRSPFVLGGWFLKLGSSLFNRPAFASPESNPLTQQQRLATILDRLETLRQEQDDLLKEVRTILGNGPGGVPK
jgi:urea transporter